MGMISALGAGYRETLASFEASRRNAAPPTLFKTPLRHPVFEVRNLPDKYHLTGQRSLGLALHAVRQALENAGLEQGDMAGAGIAIGTTVACELNDLAFYSEYRRAGDAPMDAVERFLKGNPAAALAKMLGLRGPRMTVANACSSGTDAIGVALSWIRAGLCEIAIAGGTDELNRIPYCGFSSLGIVNPGLCSPFDRDRRGLNLGEGAGVLVLESEGSARRRGARADLRLLGYGTAADAYHLTSPHPGGRGLTKAIYRAMQEAAISPAEIAFVNAHGTGTMENDKVEGAVLANIFGNDAKVLSTKGYTGHTLGAAGGLEAAFTAMGLREGWLPASAGFQNRDEGIPITPLTQRTAVEGRHAISTSLAFGGNNSALVIGLYS